MAAVGNPAVQRLTVDLLPATVFRERMIALADDYDRLQSIVIRTVGKSASPGHRDLLPAESNISELCETIRQETSMPTSVPSSESRLRGGAKEPGSRPSNRRASNSYLLQQPESEEGSTTPDTVKGALSDLFHSEDARSDKDRTNRKLSLSSGRSAKMRKHVLRSKTPELSTVCTAPFTFLAGSRHFLRFIGFVILMNVVFMGCSAEIGMNDVKDGEFGRPYVPLQLVEATFCLIYVAELVIRLVASGRNFFCDPEERAWNLFDVVLVMQAVYEVSSFIVDATGPNGLNLSFLRALRFMKGLKALRVIRLIRSLRELRLIIVLILGSLWSMVWSFALLGVSCYIFALIIVLGVFEALKDGANFEEEWVQEILEYWGSMGTAMITLVMSTCGGIDWRPAWDALGSIGGLIQGFFILYVAWFMFVMSNVITAVVVESMLYFGGKDFQHSIQNELEKKEEYEDSLRLLFQEMDSSGDGLVSYEEFKANIQVPELRAFFSSLEIEIADAELFFYLLSDGGKSSVTLGQFVSGCIRMRGHAQSVDLNDVRCKQERMQNSLTRLAETIAVYCNLTTKTLARLEQHALSVSSISMTSLIEGSGARRQDALPPQTEGTLVLTPL